MSYFDIRKRARLKHLPAPDPELIRAGISDKDQRLRTSRDWIEMYHAEKEQPETAYDEG